MRDDDLRTAQPSKKRFSVRRVQGGGDLWISELVVTYAGRPSYVVSSDNRRDVRIGRIDG